MRSWFRSGVFAAVAALLAVPVRAEDFPSRPVHIVVPFAAGGGNDLLARTVGDGMSKVLNQPVIIDNKGGASGTVGVQYVMRSRPDGYTMVMGGIGSMVLRPLVEGSKNPYDPNKDFAPVALVATGSPVLLVNRQTGVDDLKGLVALAQKQRVTYGSAGVGSTIHLTAELLQKVAGIKLAHVPYYGQGPVLNDLVAGHIDAAFMDVSIALPFTGSDRVKIIAIAGRQRAPQLPDVPTAAEQGYPDLIMENWYGLFAPKATPQAIVAKLSAAVTAAVHLPETARIIEQNVGMAARAGDPAQLSNEMADDTAKWAPVVAAAGIKPQ